MCCSSSTQSRQFKGISVRSSLTDTMVVLKYFLVNCLFTCVGQFFSLLDIVLDIYTAVSFYQEKAYICLGILLLILVGSSVLVQIFSWLFYSYEDCERCLSRSKLKLLHAFQLGIFFRWYESLCVKIGCFSFPDREDIAEYLSHDLSLLRLIETFSESIPQLVLMLTIILQRGHLNPITVLKAVWSALLITVSVTMYHRSMRSFLPDKKKQPPSSSVVYFLWNLFLISSRLTALALFASVLPCFIFIHFVCSWLVLFFFAWRSKTDFMEKPCGEWFYRATVGLIWYFDWFNAVEGRTRYRTLLYHGYILADIVLLCSLWCWKMSTEPPSFEIPQLYAIITAACVVSVYILGLLFKIVYYQFYHPNLAKDELKGGPTGDVVDGDINPQAIILMGDADVDVTVRSMPSSPAPDVKHYNKRMRKLAENFYAS
ncbi:XK-related protein 8-like [Thunnus maccoyii]|uniref:XK-related protein 8-like n=1 Tax=Thunnus maccoyii TaxID=8240 RepID=UPI001C4BB09A|nr:XK-related protein 8-like [Thunnus maccoyii]